MSDVPHETTRLIGVISDTHGLLRPEAVEALNGVELILHAGDVGKPEVLDQLRLIAPVVAVRGNIDKGEWGQELPTWETVEVGGVSIYMLHIAEELNLDPAAAGFQVVVSGHTHQPLIDERKGVLYVNPGSAGPRRFRLPITLAHLSIDNGHVTVQIIDLKV